MTEMGQWREHILHRTLWANTLLASIAYIPGVVAAWKDGLWLLIAINTLVLGLLITITRWQGLGLRLRAGIFIGAWYLFSAFLLWLLGPVGVGIVWVLAVPIFSALFFGYPGAWSGTALVAILTLIYPVLPPSTQTDTVAIFNLQYTPVAWIAISGSLLFLSCLISLAIAKLLSGLEQLVVEQAVSNEHLKAHLEKESALQEALLVSRKHNAMGTLAGGIAHDFNNLLLPIMLGSESARDQAAQSSEQRKSLDLVIQSAERASNLVRQILRFSQNVDVELEPVKLQPILDEVVALLRGSAGHKVPVDCKNEVQNAFVKADADAIHQVLMNLGKNALLALPSANPRLSLLVRRNTDENEVEILVSDNGRGIPKSIQDRIFDPYFSTRPSGTGTGLGLAIVYQLVTTAMNGRITFSSDEETGTTFTVSLPETTALVATEIEIHKPISSDTDSVSVEKGSILVVDDDELVSATLRAILQGQGLQVEVCNDGDAALTFIRENPECIDIVIADKTMPGMSGLELARQLRQHWPSLRIILMSGYFTEEDQSIITNLGLTGVLNKPFRRDMVIEVMGKLPSSVFQSSNQ